MDYYEKKSRFRKELASIITKNSTEIELAYLYDYVMEKYGFSEKTVKKTLDRMEELGYISIYGGVVKAEV